MKIYCYDGEFGTDAHGLVMEVDPREGVAVQTDPPVDVTDLNTGKRYRVDRADCGAPGCMCAARAIPLVEVNV